MCFCSNMLSFLGVKNFLNVPSWIWTCVWYINFVWGFFMESSWFWFKNSSNWILFRFGFTSYLSLKLKYWQVQLKIEKSSLRLNCKIVGKPNLLGLIMRHNPYWIVYWGYLDSGFSINYTFDLLNPGKTYLGSAIHEIQ